MIDISNDRMEFDLNGDKNCGVVAFSEVLGLSYMETWSLIKEYIPESRNSLKEVHKKGLFNLELQRIYKSIGAELIWDKWGRGSKNAKKDKEENNNYELTKRFTVRRAIENYCQCGKYIIEIDAHMFAVIDGKIINDWITEGRRFGVYHVYQIPS